MKEIMFSFVLALEGNTCL